MKPIYLFLIGFIFLQTPFLSAQINVPELGELFRDDVIPRVDIIMPADSLDILFLPENVESNHHYLATFIFNNGTVHDTLYNVGFRLRGNTSRYAEKKSFKISFNTYEPGRKYDGVEKMNINGQQNDPTMMRSKISWEVLREMKVAGSRVNHVELYINDNYYGVYLNIEHIDEEFAELRFGNKDGNLYKCLWPADLVYMGGDPDLYKQTNGDRRTYELHTNTDLDDYSDIAHFIDVLNNTPTNNLACELEQIFNVDDYLKYLAMDIFTGNWDGPLYNKNNFYLYHNTATDKLEYIPYDLDNTFGVDWFDRDWATRNIYDWGNHGEPRPLYWNIMAVQEYRDRFTFYMTLFQATIFRPDILSTTIDEYKNLISPSMSTDPFSPLDYGFSYQDFLASFNQTLSTPHLSYGLKPFISTRYASTFTQLENNNISPIIRHLHNNRPNQNQDINITSQVIDDNMLSNVKICYSINNENSTTCLPIFDDGQHNDGLANDGTYGIIIPAIEQATSLHYYIDATDETGLRSRFPRCNRQNITFGTTGFQLYINEFMASNNTTIADEAGEFDDWLELYYNGPAPLYLGDKYLSDKENTPNKWLMPDISIAPGEHLLFWADEDQEQGPMHTNFKLSADGEFIGIFDSEENNFALIDGHSFGEQQSDVAVGRIPDGTGVFQEVIATPAAMNEAVVGVTDPTTRVVGGGVRAYPNPFSNHITLECFSEFPDQWTAELFDPLGRLIMVKKVNTGITTLSMEGLSLTSGVYLLRVAADDGSFRVIKMLLIE